MRSLRALIVFTMTAAIALASACSSPPVRAGAGGPSTRGGPTTKAGQQAGGIVVSRGPAPPAPGAPGKVEAGRPAGGGGGSAGGASAPVTTIRPPGASGGGGSAGSYVGPSYYPAPAQGLGVSVAGTATVVKAADRARILAVRHAYEDGTSANRSATEADRKRIADRLVPAGVADSDVTLPADQYYGPPGSVVSVKVAPARAESLTPLVRDAVNAELGRVDWISVRASLTDCSQATAEVRKAALDNGRVNADALARAAGLALGPIVALSESSDYHSPPLAADASPPEICFVDGYSNPGGSAVVNLNVTVYGYVNVSYAIAGSGPVISPTVSGSGHGQASAPADQARVVVHGFDEQADANTKGETRPGPTPGPSATRPEAAARTTDRVAALGVDRAAIKIFGTVVNVDIAPDRVASLGPQIVEIVDDEFGGVYSQGVVYGRSDCRDLEVKAREAAVAEARDRASALAGAASRGAGPVQSLSESGPYSQSYHGYGGGDSPCALGDPTAYPNYGYGSGPEVFAAPGQVSVGVDVYASYVMT